jgi:thiosulfate/3-mercaptopyruvate sulfurtransferase
MLWAMSEYARPEFLVSTDWVADHLGEPGLRLIQADEDVAVYDSGHIPGAVTLNWETELQDQLLRDYISKENFEQLMRRRGIERDQTLVFYGDDNNWWACYAFWAFRVFGHENMKIMNGGRSKWIAEKRPLEKDLPEYPETDYTAGGPDYTWRAFRYDVMPHVAGSRPLVDVRTPEEFSGELLHMPEYPQEGALRGGHIPGAVNVPWEITVNEDGTFKSADELRKLYCEQHGLKPDDPVITYCRIGERSAHSWFVLTYLLGFKRVRNYDGSWTEWGNLVGAPIERS